MNKQEKAQVSAATLSTQANVINQVSLNYTSGQDANTNTPQSVKKYDTEVGRWDMTQGGLDFGGDV